MTWDLAVVLVPLLVVPVLLWGFAGCSEFAAEDDPLTAAFNLRARGIGEQSIELTWEHASAGGVIFRVGRQRLDGSWDDGFATPAGTAPRSHVDTAATGGTFYNYRIITATSTTTLGTGLKSNEARTRALIWEAAYDKPLTADGQGFPGDTLVQRIDKTLLAVKGKPQQIKLTLRGSSAAVLRLDRLYISSAVPTAGIPSNPTPDPWDSALDLMAIHSGGPPLELLPGTPRLIGPLNYVLNTKEDFILACDINSAAGAVRRREGDVGQSICYVNANATEANKADRQSVAGQWDVKPANASRAVFLVEKIEVLTADPAV